MRNDFCIFILSHGRADRVHTIKSLESSNNRYPVYIIIDDEDNSASEYYKRFGDSVIKFCKEQQAKVLDTPDTSKDKRTIVYARNACFDIAERLGYKYFLELDDDYTGFYFRYPQNRKLISQEVKCFSDVCDAFIDFLECSKCKTVCFAQAGDYIGGLKAKTGGAYRKKILRKSMNSFFCKTENRINFLGRINEDVNTYSSRGSVGELFFTITDIMLNQKQTQKNYGGMTDIYCDMGTYLKSFYTVVFAPDKCVVEPMSNGGGNTYNRIHHRIDWGKCTPMIISDKWKKR